MAAVVWRQMLHRARYLCTGDRRRRRHNDITTAAAANDNNIQASVICVYSNIMKSFARLERGKRRRSHKYVTSAGMAEAATNDVANRK